jgi:hypothetical protein
MRKRGREQQLVAVEALIAFPPQSKISRLKNTEIDRVILAGFFERVKLNNGNNNAKQAKRKNTCNGKHSPD